jgi:hypothetical protein
MRRGHPDTRGSNSAASSEQIQSDSLAQEQKAGLSANGCDVPYRLELVTLGNVPLDSFLRDVENEMSPLY